MLNWLKSSVFVKKGVIFFAFKIKSIIFVE